jgi:hypothetical protein
LKKTIAFMLAAIAMFAMSVAPVYADDDEGNEAKENEADEKSGSGNDEKEKSVPGFEVAFTVGGILGAARLLRARIA